MNSYLDNLSDNELQRIVIMNLESFFQLIRKHYKKYPSLRNIAVAKDARSAMVQRMLPPSIVKLYRHKDILISKYMYKMADNLITNFVDILNETLEKTFDIDSLLKLSTEELANAFSVVRQREQHDFDIEIVWIQMKLLGFSDVDQRKKNIVEILGIDDGNTEFTEPILEHPSQKYENETDTDDSTEVSSTRRKTKAKKLTPEEKAAKHKAAENAKKLKLEKEKQINEMEEKQFDEEVAVANPAQTIQCVPLNEKEVKESYSQMIKYIGVISIKGDFYNFTPIGEIDNEEYYAYSETDLDIILPESEKHNINFFYNHWTEAHHRFMAEYFYDNQLVVLNCEVSDLQDNYAPDGSRNQTGYKIAALDQWKTGKICFPSALGAYTLLQNSVLLDGLDKKIVRIDSDDLIVDQKIMINMGDGFYAGPYTVKHSSVSDAFYISPQEASKHCIFGYQSKDCKRVVVEPSYDVEKWIGYNSWDLYLIKDGARQIVKDCISDQVLLSDFKTVLSKTQGIDYSNLDVDGIIERLGESEIVGTNVPDDIKTSRIDRLKKILTSEECIGSIYQELSGAFIDLLVNNSDSQQMEQLLSDIIGKKPELIENIPAYRSALSKAEKLRGEVEQLQAQKEDTELQIKNAGSGNVTDANVEESLSARVVELKAELADMMRMKELVVDVVEVQKRLDELKDDAKYYENHKLHLANDTKVLESSFIKMLNGYSEKVADVTFDGFISSKMLQSAADWETKEETTALANKVDAVNGIQCEEMSPNELVDYVTRTIQSLRPGYSKNAILNIMICSTQGFLTVFSGMPGCGKTSICNIVAKVLGLNVYEDNISGETVSRYIPVSVERGWTSKRDFIGYYNPLTKAFEESNREVFDGLRLLDMESKRGYTNWPFFILLDEANLSPMEYYWADFMNVCDDLSDLSSINLGNNNLFRIPETLHFLATINNDHTTETLSPRLIDRAWIITLPKISSVQYGNKIQDSVLKRVSWQNIKETFVRGNTNNVFDRETVNIYDGLRDRLNKIDIYISPRVDIAIKKYWSVASELMEEDEYGNASGIVALDYAIAQKILPKIIGSGDEYEESLKILQEYCKSKNLLFSASLLQNIITRGNRQMKYYQFFN